jgi:hypothetical protein
MTERKAKTGAKTEAKTEAKAEGKARANPAVLAFEEFEEGGFVEDRDVELAGFIEL